MNQLASRAILACVLMLVFASYLAAQSDTGLLAKDPVTGLTAEEAVKFGVDKFTDLYEKKSQDGSTTLGMVEASQTYLQLRYYINDRAVVKRTKKQQALIATIRDYCFDIATAYIDIAEASGNGGSILRIDKELEMIDIETSIGKVILSMEQPKANPQGREKAEKTLTSLITGIKNLPKLDTDDPKEAELLRDQYNTAIKRLHTTLPKLRAILKSVPDNGRVALAKFAKDASQELACHLL